MKNITIWSFISAILCIYGIIILSAGAYYCYHPVKIALAQDQVCLWWGAVLLIFGVAFQYLHTRLANLQTP